MQKDTALSILRTVLTLAGTYIIGHNIFGHTVDQNMWQVVGAAVASLASIIWGIVDKTATIEQVQSVMRSVLVSIGGLLVAAGKITGETLEGILGLVAAIIPALQSHTSKVKIQQLASGKVEPTVSGKVEPTGPKFR